MDNHDFTDAMDSDNSITSNKAFSSNQPEKDDNLFEIIEVTSHNSSIPLLRQWDK